MDGRRETIPFSVRINGHIKENDMTTETVTKRKPMRVEVVNSLTGMVWFIGWLFTLAFAHLDLVHALLGLVVWPYYLGLALR